MKKDWVDKFEDHMTDRFGSGWSRKPWGTALVISISVPLAIVLGVVIAADRNLPPSPEEVHAALLSVMPNPPSKNTVILWSANSRKEALNWADNPTLPKPYFIK